MYKLSPIVNKESIKQLEIGSVIIYNHYIDNLKLKIYNVTYTQNEYLIY